KTRMRSPTSGESSTSRSNGSMRAPTSGTFPSQASYASWGQSPHENTSGSRSQENFKQKTLSRLAGHRGTERVVLFAAPKEPALPDRFVDDNGRGGRFDLILAVNRVEDFLPVDRHFLGGHNAQTHLVAADLHHGDSDVVVDDDTFVFFPGQY